MLSHIGLGLRVVARMAIRSDGSWHVFASCTRFTFSDQLGAAFAVVSLVVVGHAIISLVSGLMIITREYAPKEMPPYLARGRGHFLFVVAGLTNLGHVLSHLPHLAWFHQMPCGDWCFNCLGFRVVLQFSMEVHSPMLNLGARCSAA